MGLCERADRSWVSPAGQSKAADLIAFLRNPDALTPPKANR